MYMAEGKKKAAHQQTMFVCPKEEKKSFSFWFATVFYLS